MNMYMIRNVITSSLTKRLGLLTVIGLLLSALPVQAQQFVAEYPVIDCGKTGFMVPVTATFQLRNKSKRRVVIDGVKADCGCTKTEVSKRELNAGDACEVKLTYDARMLGHFHKQAAVSYHYRQSTNNQAPLYLTMKGVVLTEVKDYSGIYPYAMGDLLADKNVLEFDDVNRGDQPEVEVNVLNNGDTPMRPNIQHLPSYLTAQAIPEQLQPGRAGKVLVRLHSEKIHDFGLTQSTVFLASQLGEKVVADNEVPVSVVLLPDLKLFEGKNKQFAPKLELTSDTMLLGMVDGKVRKKAEIIISNTGRQPLTISSLQMFTSGLRLTLDKRELQPGEQAKLKVVGDLNVLRKVRTKPRLLMITNDPDHSKQVITIVVK